jgi:hypothetical protein
MAETQEGSFIGLRSFDFAAARKRIGLSEDYSFIVVAFSAKEGNMSFSFLATHFCFLCFT